MAQAAMDYFVECDDLEFPQHWLTFGQRFSAVSGAPRLAVNPANAMLNYLYAILEAEARLALRAGRGLPQR